MESLPLENTDIVISRIVFGAWAIGGWYWGGQNDDDSVAAIDAALGAGITTFDTAPVYGFGKSESVLGEALEKKRDQVVLMTKCGLRHDLAEKKHFFSTRYGSKTYDVHRNLSKDSILFECEQSLKRLRTDRIDVYQLHWFDPATLQSETAEALNELYRNKMIRSVGVCNHTVHRILSLRRELEVPLVVDQEKLNLIQRKAMDGNIPYARKNRVAFLAYSPLAQGLLTGEVGLKRVFAKEDYRNQSDLMSDHFRNSIVEIEKEFRERFDFSLAELALAWTFRFAGAHAAIAGIRTAKQALNNSRACTVSLQREEWEFLTERFTPLQYSGKW